MKLLSQFLKWSILFFQCFILVAVILCINNVINLNTSNTTGTLIGLKFFGEPSLFIYYSIISAYIFALLFLVYLLNIFRNVVTDFSNELIFTSKNGKQLEKLGKGFILFGFCLAILLFLVFFINHGLKDYSDIADPSMKLAAKMGYQLGVFIARLIKLIFPIFIPALFILLIAKLIKKGTSIKTENDLTI